jgi:two-component system phosphate regulon sensor histidine kinase PhoR
LLPTIDVDDLLRTDDAEPPMVELDLPGPPPRRVLVHASRTAVRDGAVLLLEDVTDVRRLENVRRDFVANVSHELRTPVSVIRASAEALIDGGLDDKARAARFAAALHRNAERLSRLVSDLLDLARIESGRHAITMSTVCVADVVKGIVDNLQPIIDARHHSVVVDVPDDVIALADGSGLEQVLSNLLDNAAKYTPEVGRIVVRARHHDQRVVIEVEDNGPGIPAEHRDRVFERFYRVDAGRSREMGGTGLGLSIVKHLVAIMDGDVRVEAAEPSGARFVVDLPLGRAP